jgi:hypothetical protein
MNYFFNSQIDNFVLAIETCDLLNWIHYDTVHQSQFLVHKS